MRVEQHPALNQVTHYSVGWKEDEVLYCTDKLAIKEIGHTTTTYDQFVIQYCNMGIVLGSTLLN